MPSLQAQELGRLNAEIVGHLLAQRSPPRELIARRDQIYAGLQPTPRRQPVAQTLRRLKFWS
jgi:hypothetical protein